MPPSIQPWDFWREVLKSPRCVLAPMVDASELAWRLISRKYGAQLAYTPMIHAGMFVRDTRYRRDNIASCPEDRPLIIQFCANDPDTLLEAARLAEPHGDAIDLNLGCPQTIARKGHYGSFLQDEWDLISRMVKLVHKELSIPITCKIRVFEDVAKSVEYAQMLERSGCYALTVHGRTREQKGPLTGLASWKHIQAVKDAVKIPVIANGNIQYLADVERCISATGVDAVMSAEGNLTNPAIFAGIQPPVWEMAKEYLSLVEKYPCPLSYTRGHLFKLFHHCLTLEDCVTLREALAKGSTLEDLKTMTLDLEKYFLPYHSGEKAWSPPAGSLIAQLPFHPWLCQPYVRPPPEDHLKKMELINSEMKRARESDPQDVPEGTISKKKMKKLAKRPGKLFRVGREILARCANCPNPLGGKCRYSLCKKCCRDKCYKENLNCEGHRIRIQFLRQRAQEREHAENGGDLQPSNGSASEAAPVAV